MDRILPIQIFILLFGVGMSLSCSSLLFMLLKVRRKRKGLKKKFAKVCYLSNCGDLEYAYYIFLNAGKRLDALVRTLDLERIFQSYDLHGPQRLRTLSPLVIWEKGAGGVEVQNASVSEAAVNFLLNAGMLRGNLQARGDFDSLTIPFRSVATNLADGAAETFGSGDLAQVVRASMAVPVVFEPVEINGQYYIDGWLSENFPAQAARDAGAERLIISDVTGGTMAQGLSA